MQKDKAFKRVIKKLNAVRAVLQDDEREVLDEIITTEPEEVQAHRIALNESAKAATTGAKKQVGAHRIALNESAKAATTGAKKQVGAHRIALNESAKAAVSGSKKQVGEHR